MITEKKLADYVNKVSFPERLAHPGPWWELLSPEDQKEVEKLMTGLFAEPKVS